MPSRPTGTEGMLRGTTLVVASATTFVRYNGRTRRRLGRVAVAAEAPRRVQRIGRRLPPAAGSLCARLLLRIKALAMCRPHYTELAGHYHKQGFPCPPAPGSQSRFSLGPKLSATVRTSNSTTPTTAETIAAM